MFGTERRIVTPTCEFTITGAPSAGAGTCPLSTGCEVNPSPTRSWSPSTKLLVGRDFKRDCLSPRNSRKFFGRELKVVGLLQGAPSFALATWRQESQDVHQHQENKRVLALKRMAVRENDYRGKHHYSPKRWTRQSASATSTCGSLSRVFACNSWRNLRARTVLALFLRGQLLAGDRHGRNL